MVLQPVNFWAILASGVVFMLIGSLWYSPFMFGTIWMKLVGLKKFDATKAEMGKTYGASFVASMVVAYVLGNFLHQMHVTNILQGAGMAAVIWMGFIATTYGINSLYLKKPMQLYLIDVGYHLVYMLAMGMIMAKWA